VKIFLILLLIFPGIAYGQITKSTVLNFTNGSYTSAGGQITITIQCAGGSNDLLLENGAYLLLESGGKIIL